MHLASFKAFMKNAHVFPSREKHSFQKFLPVFRSKWTLPLFSICCSWKDKHIILKVYSVSLEAFVKNAHAFLLKQNDFVKLLVCFPPTGLLCPILIGEEVS